MMLIGLTGSMASGKSTVAAMLKKAKVPVIDADDLARRVCDISSPSLKKIVEKFGSGVLNQDGSLNRSALGAFVFNDQRALKELEEILHPAIHQLYLEELTYLKDKGERIVVYMAPLLFEKKLETSFDKTILVTAPDAVLLKRAAKRDNMSYDEANKRLSQQMSTQQKALIADEIINNNGTKEELFMQLKEVWQKIAKMDLTE